jgi:DNA-binding response OmpR family regulator
MSDPTTVLVAESDDALRQELIHQLSADAFEAEPARSVAEARRRAARGPDLLLLGELEDRLAALRLMRAIRSADALACRIDPALPVIVLSGEDGDWAPLRAFEAGCDDFVRYLELRAALSALLRRCEPGRGRRSRCVGALTIDQAGREVRYAGRWIELSRIEWELLTYLAADPLRVFTKRELLRDLWGATGPRARPAPPRPTPVGCGANSNGQERAATCSTVAESGTGWSAGPRPSSTRASNGEPRPAPRAR